MAKINANYEALYILDPALSEEAIAALVAKFKAVVEANGTVSEVDMEHRRLAYPINDLIEGLLRPDDLQRRCRHPRRAGPYLPDHRRRDAFPHRLQGPVRGSGNARSNHYHGSPDP